MGVLDLAGERDRHEPVDAANRLGAAIESWRSALDIVGTGVRAPNHLTIDSQLATVTFTVVMPLVARLLNGDEHVLSDAMALLRRYVRTPHWVEPAPPLADDDSSEEFLVGSPIVHELPRTPSPRAAPESPQTELGAPPTTPLPNQRPIRRDPFNSPTRYPKPDLRANETLDDDIVDEGDSDNDEPMSLAKMSVSSVVMRATTDQTSIESALVEAAIVCVRLAASNVRHDDDAESEFYNRIPGAMAKTTRLTENFKAMSENITMESLILREAAVLTALHGRTATASLFDMWTFFDASTVPALTANTDTAATLRAMATVLLTFVQLDQYSAVQQPWLTAAAVAIMLADSMLTRNVVERITVDVYAALLTEADHHGTWTLETAREAIVARTNYVRESLVEFSSRGSFGTFRKTVVRRRSEQLGDVYQRIGDIDVVSVVNHIEATAPFQPVRDASGVKRARQSSIVASSMKRSWWVGAALLPHPSFSQS